MDHSCSCQLQESKREYTTAGFLNAGGKEAGGAVTRLGREIAAIALTSNNTFSRLVNQRVTVLRTIRKTYASELAKLQAGSSITTRPPTNKFPTFTHVALQGAMRSLMIMFEDGLRRKSPLTKQMLREFLKLIKTVAPGAELRSHLPDLSASAFLCGESFDALSEILCKVLVTDNSEFVDEQLKLLSAEVLLRMNILRADVAYTLRALDILMTRLPSVKLPVGDCVSPMLPL